MSKYKYYRYYLDINARGGDMSEFIDDMNLVFGVDKCFIRDSMGDGNIGSKSILIYSNIAGRVGDVLGPFLKHFLRFKKKHYKTDFECIRLNMIGDYFGEQGFLTIENNVLNTMVECGISDFNIGINLETIQA
jgi:hypothetical protein